MRRLRDWWHYRARYALPWMRLQAHTAALLQYAPGAGHWLRPYGLNHWYCAYCGQHWRVRWRDWLLCWPQYAWYVVPWLLPQCPGADDQDHPVIWSDHREPRRNACMRRLNRVGP